MHQGPTSTEVDVSVLVPVLNEGATIAEVVAAMTAQRFDGTVELLFADGGSNDDTKAQLSDLARSDPRIRVFDNPRRGVASGLNVCLREARGRYVARMDGHALYPPTYLRDGVRRLQAPDAASDVALDGATRARAYEPGQDPDAASDDVLDGATRARAYEAGQAPDVASVSVSGEAPNDGARPRASGRIVAWVAGPQVPVPRGRFGAAIAAALGTRLGQGGSRRWSGPGAGLAADGGPGERIEEYDLDTGVFCGVWRREEVLAKGGWDEAWVCNEDSELAARFHEAGQRIVCVPAMGARYFPRTSLPALWRQYRAYGAYRAKTAGRHPASLRRSAVLPPLLVLDLAASMLAPGRLRRLARLGLRAYLGALLLATVEAVRRPEDDLRHDAGSPDGRPADPPHEPPGPAAERLSNCALVPAAVATMHVAHGVGFLEGCARWGVPWRALARILGDRTEPAPYDGPIDAPSLHAPGAAEAPGVKALDSHEDSSHNEPGRSASGR
jgi:glycosyltransferase involved in cell wall biosynthesis